MKLILNLRLEVGDKTVDLQNLTDNLDSYRPALKDLSSLEGCIQILLNGKEVVGDYADPALLLVDQWLQKLPWIIGGDTETVALRHSEQCFAFVPAGESVEMSFFTGSEAEIEDYLMEPVTVRLLDFVQEIFKIADGLLGLCLTLDKTLLQSNVDVKDLNLSLNEAKKAWRNHLLHSRR